MITFYQSPQIKALGDLFFNTYELFDWTLSTFCGQISLLVKTYITPTWHFTTNQYIGVFLYLPSHKTSFCFDVGIFRLCYSFPLGPQIYPVIKFSYLITFFRSLPVVPNLVKNPNTKQTNNMVHYSKFSFSLTFFLIFGEWHL